MAETKVIMPQMGESIFEGTITKWLKKPGDQVQRDEPLFEISTDKIDTEIPSPAAGVLQDILVKEGQTVQINTVVATIGDGAGKPAGDEGKAAPKQEAEAKQPSKEQAPKEQPSKEQPSKEQPSKQQAKEPAKEQPKEAQKQAPKEVKGPAPVAGPTSETKAEEHAPSGEEEDEEVEESAVSGASSPESAASGDDVRSSPLVRRIAKENGVDLSALAGKGTGINGRITKTDILSYIEQGGKKETAPAAPATTVSKPGATSAPAAPPPASVTFSGATERVPLTAMRKAIAEHMLLSRKTSAHVTTFFEVDCSRIMKAKEQQQADFDRSGARLTVTPFFVQAVANALKRFPIVNSSLDGDTIVYKRAINIGIAVNLEGGLIVPVLKGADEKNLLGLARAINDLGERARNKKLTPDDVKDGTFTITNPGQYGALIGTPIINQPQVAIMGMGGIKKRAVVIDDAIAIRPIIMLSLSFDHRVIDGATADQFMAEVQKQLENWAV
jgi:pyruvate dehydrogenase E2 component (dihydrolipoamide acetyltransferase)